MKRTLIPAVALLLLSLPCAPRARAQQPVAPPDTTTGSDSLAVSPRGALLRSLALPGWGQAYVGAPVRGAVYFGLESGSLWMLVKSRRQLAQARAHERYLKSVDKLEPTQSLGLAESRRKQVEDWITLSLFFMLFSGADAYVSAQLSDFGQHIGVLPAGDGALMVDVRLPLGGRR